MNNLSIVRVQSWGQKSEPAVGSVIYCNGPDPLTPTDVPWREVPVSSADTSGIYLGGMQVVVSKGAKA